MTFRDWGRLAIYGAIVFLILGLSCSRRYIYDTPQKNAEQLTPNEINAFLELWPEYLQTNASKSEPQQISLTTGYPSEKYSPQLRRWFEYKKWNIDRFFYVEQRLKAIVKTEMLLNNISANKKMAAQGERNLHPIIAEQEKRVGAEKVTDEELEMVRPVLYKIHQILEAEKAE